MDYAEATYFDHYAFHHIAAYWEHRRLRGIERRGRQLIARR